jgi:hypothetical protein
MTPCERPAYEMAYERCTPLRWHMGETRMYAYEMHVCERHAYEMAPVRGTPMRWPMGEARL